MMQQIVTDVLIIGGGATGLGTLRDLAMRGVRATLVEKGDLTHGTTGRYHGLLHSGGRYVAKDPQSATECAEENVILRRIMPQYIEDTGGFFVTTPWDDPDYGEVFVQGCKATGVPVQEISVAEALRREPHMHPGITRVFEVLDGSADSFMSAYGIANSARQHGGVVLNYHYVTDLERTGDRVTAAIVEDLRTGELRRIEATVIVNAAGAWAGKIAKMAGVDVSVLPGKGTMIAMNHRMVNTVINRCKPPDDGDILVPIHTVAVIGTTDIPVPDPDVFTIEPHEVTFLMDEGAKLVPNFANYRALRAWAGVRPLYKDDSATSDRDISRAYKILDHAERHGIQGFISIVGGKWTTYRLMAEHLADLVATKIGNTAPCRTAEEVIELPDGGNLYWLGHNLHHVEENHAYGELVCECELVTRQQVIDAIQTSKAANLDDIRRETRLGMGPCQGGFCTYRAAAIWDEVRPQTNDEGYNGSLVRHFLQARWKGLTPIMWGDQLRQARLDQLIYLDTLGVDLLPAELTAKPEEAHELVTEHEAIATEYHVE